MNELNKEQQENLDLDLSVREALNNQFQILKELGDIDWSALETEAFLRKIKLEPYAKNQYFPHNIGFRYFIPQELASAIQQKLAEQPELALSFGLESVPNYYDDAYANPPEFATMEEFDMFIKAKDEEVEAKKNALIKKTVSNVLRNKFQIDADIDEEVAEEIYETLLQCQNLTIECAYFAQTLDSAARRLSKLAPSLASLIEANKKKLLITRYVSTFTLSNFSANYPGKRYFNSVPFKNDMAEEEYERMSSRMNDWAFGVSPKLNYGSIVIVNARDVDWTNFEIRHFERLIIVAHELMHAVLADLLEIKNYTDKHNKIDKQKNYSAEILRTLFEGVSIAFERALCSQIENDTSLEESWRQDATNFKRFREKYLHESHQFWNKEERKKLRWNKSERIPHTEYIASLSYSEGALLAASLHKGGWQLEDLPELVKAIKELFESELGITDINDLEQIPLVKGKRQSGISASIYLRLRKKLRQLRPQKANQPTAA